MCASRNFRLIMTQQPMTDRWLLPEGVEGLLPKQAEYLEQLRRQLLDLFHSCGYELVMPPLIEYLDSLLVGTGHDLDLQTFKLIDQHTGRLMGLRADMTPQVARIDAHQLRRETPTRLCYMGSVLHTRAEQGNSRSPLQIGAELYGHAGAQSDVEVLCLMLDMISEVGLEGVSVDIGHVGIFRGLSQQAGLTDDQEQLLFDALQRKSKPEIGEYIASSSLDDDLSEMILALADLNGSVEVIERARVVLAKASDVVHRAIDNVATIAEQVMQRNPGSLLHFDLAELRGFNYHTGVVFAAYLPGCSQALAQGGRYDDIGKAFGRARPATGFSADLKQMVAQLDSNLHNVSAIFAPYGNDPALREAINDLRVQGERVIEALPGQQAGANEMACDRVLVKQKES